MRIFSILFVFITTLSLAQSPVTYTLDFSNIQHHELKVSVSFQDIQDSILLVRMPSTSPGRYADHNFVKNLYQEAAFDENGNTVEFHRNTPFEWKLPVNNGFVRFDYTIYGNHADGTYLGVDSRKLHMNMPATFPFGEGLDDREINLIIPKHDNWDVATQLVKENETTFSAPNYYYFYDSPTMVGEISWRRWEVDGQTIEIAMMHEGSEQELDDYTEWVKRVVLQEKQIFGELPKYDFGRYTFLMAYNPWVHGDGMEHRNSTVCSSQGSLQKHSERLISTVAHEFFHCWNIERIRPKSLEPYDFTKVNMSEALWFGEGFTSYYDDLSLTRAGILSPESYINRLIGTLNYVLNSPGRSFRGPVAMSQNAVFTDAGTSNDETNFANTYVSYYPYGQVVGLGLDLTLRSKYDKTLDQFMQLVWQQYGKPEIPYTMQNLEDLLAQFTKDATFAQEFFDKDIYGSDLPDFAALFESFGIKMSLQSPQSPYLNNPRIENGIVQSSIIKGTALYEAGVEKGDKIISIDGHEIENTSDLNRVINRMAVGETYPIIYEQLGERFERSFTTVQDPRIVLSYIADDKLKKSQVKRRNAWLGIE